MPLTDSLRDDILASVPSLRAFAISLSGNGDRADDLVQETLAAGDCRHRLVPARIEPAGVAVHHPAQPVSLRSTGSGGAR